MILTECQNDKKSLCFPHASALTLLLKFHRNFRRSTAKPGGGHNNVECGIFNYELWTMHYALMETAAFMFLCLSV